jgi:hypothetical protein
VIEPELIGHPSTTSTVKGWERGTKGMEWVLAKFISMNSVDAPESRRFEGI